jgi:hypothetical protein
MNVFPDPVGSATNVFCTNAARIALNWYCRISLVPGYTQESIVEGHVESCVGRVLSPSGCISRLVNIGDKFYSFISVYSYYYFP